MRTENFQAARISCAAFVFGLFGSRRGAVRFSPDSRR